MLLTADSGPEKRYRQWLAVSRGAVRAVVGHPGRDVRAGRATWAWWPSGTTATPATATTTPPSRTPGRSWSCGPRTAGCAFLLGGHELHGGGRPAGRDAAGRCPLRADREPGAARGAPRCVPSATGSSARDGAARSARLPSLAWQTVRDGLRSGPVLVQVPRRGYAPRLACERCREPARCRHCAGPLEAPDQRDCDCAWCGRAETAWHCPACGGARLRAQIVGARRTAEELGRAFPAVPVRTSGRDHVLDSVPDQPALVVSTPGAEPVAEGGYAAALLLDGWAHARPARSAGGRGGAAALDWPPPRWCGASRRAAPW